MRKGGRETHGIILRDVTCRFRSDKDALRVMLAQISPTLDSNLLTEENLAKVRDPGRQARKILKIIEHFHERDADLLLFPELVAPFEHLRAFEEALAAADREFVATICYEHTSLEELIPLLSEEEVERYGLSSGGTEARWTNFCRIMIKAGDASSVHTQIKLTPFSGEFSLSAKETLYCGKVIQRFVTNWGTWLFLICKDYVGEVGAEAKIPMFDFLKSLTDDGLHYIFVSSLNPEPEAFIHAARSFYYLQEKSAHTFTTLLNTAELDSTTVIFPERPHPRIRTTRDAELVPLFEGKPGWGTQLRFPGREEKVISGTFVRLDRYKPMPTKQMFSPVYQSEVLSLSALGIEPDVVGAVDPAAATERAARAERPASPIHNLPTQPTPFVGREEELAAIARHLEDPACRLLSLVGPGGIGKTRLALQAAREKVGRFEHGVRFVPLAPLMSADLLPSTAAASLQFSFRGPAHPAAQLIDYLRGKEMLLVMDNFEHVLEGAGLLAEILTNAPAVRFLVTSRERLNLQAESIIDIGGMRFPDAVEDSETPGYSAIELFLQTAKRVRSDFTLTADDRPHLLRICRLVEGMPLGIELAASWVRTLSCGEIAEEIEASHDFLATHKRDLPERHRSLRAVFQHSWDLLSREEQEALRYMCIFPAGSTREPAEKVAGASLPLLSALVDKSLLRRTPQGRYEIHNALRHYAMERLKERPDEYEDVQDAHARYYADFLHEREGVLKGSGQVKALEEIGDEIENVRAAWARAVETTKEELIDRSIGSLYRFFDVRGWWEEGEEAFGRAARALRAAAGGRSRSGGGEESPGAAESGEEGRPGEVGDAGGGSLAERARVLGRVLARQGMFLHRRGLHQRAEELLRESLYLLQDAGARYETSFTLNVLGLAAGRRGDHAEAKRLHGESLAICEENGDRYGVARSLNNLALIARELGEHEEAKRQHQEALRIQREIGDPPGIASSVSNLGTVFMGLGEWAEAKELLLECMAINDEIGDRHAMAACLGNLGIVAYQMGERHEGKELLLGAMAIKEEIGDLRGRAISFLNLALVAFDHGEYGEAREAQEKSLEICAAIGDRKLAGVGLSILGDIARAVGEYEEARKHLHAALNIAREIESTGTMLDVLVRIAELLGKEGEDAQALELLGLVLANPATRQDARKRADGLLSGLSSRLPSGDMEAARERGAARELDEVVKDILGDEA